MDYLVQQGYRWDLIAGVSVGALNGAMLAMNRLDDLGDIWDTITARDVYTGRLTPFYAAIRVLLGKSSVLGNEPLRWLIERYVDVDQIDIDLRIGVVSLVTGRYTVFRPHDLSPDQFKQSLLASTAMPIVWPPVTLSMELPDLIGLVDGGIRNASPLGDVIDTDPDEIVVINTGMDNVGQLKRPPRTILDIGLRTLAEITINEIFLSDMREFLRINDLVLQAGQQGVTLYKDADRRRPFKYFDALIIQPDVLLDDIFDYSRAAIERSREMGRQMAREALGG